MPNFVICIVTFYVNIITLIIKHDLRRVPELNSFYPLLTLRVRTGQHELEYDYKSRWRLVIRWLYVLTMELVDVILRILPVPDVEH